MTPFVTQLLTTYVCTTMLTSLVSNLAFIKLISASVGLIQNSREVAIKRSHGILAVTEALQLRVIAVTFRVAQQHSSRQKPLAPHSNKSARIQMSGVN